MAQQVEHVLGKDEVTGSNPVISSKKRQLLMSCLFFSLGVRNCVARLQLLCFLSVFIFGSTTLDELSFFLAGRSQLKLLGYSPIKTPKIRGFFLFFSIF